MGGPRADVAVLSRKYRITSVSLIRGAGIFDDGWTIEFRESMSTRFLIEGAAFAGVSTLGLLLTLANYRLVAQVNSLSPQELELSRVGGDVMKLMHLHREYQKLFPEGNLVLRIRVMMALMFVCLLVASLAVRGF